MLSSIDFRNNGIGFLRLFFAAVVVWSHAHIIGGFGADPFTAMGSNLNAGVMAVAAFFVLSGFLVTRSFKTLANSGRFLWHRAVRVFPGFWVCLVVTAFLLAPVAFVHVHGALPGFLSEIPSPASYVGSNFLLQINQASIGAILKGLPEPLHINYSLWTLEWECLCYLSVFLLGLLGLLRRWRILSVMLLLSAYVAVSIALATYDVQTTPLGYVIAELGVFFWIGACAYLFRDRIPMRGWLAALCALATVLALPVKAYAFIATPCFAYLILYAAMRLPIRSFDRRVDLSYGLYIYAFPIQQLLSLYGLNHFGFLAYFGLSLVTALLFAAASWFGVERPALSLKNYLMGAGAAAPSVAPR